MKKNTVALIFPDTGEKYMFNVPLSVIWVAAPLYDAGYRVEILDIRFEKEYQNRLSKIADDLICVGISSLTGPQLQSGISISKWIKNKYPNLPVVWGGWHVSILTEQSIQSPFIDYIIHGQGEIPFLELVEHLQKGKKTDHIKNLAFCDNGKVIVNGKRDLLDINDLPMKPYHLVDVSRYEGRPLTKNEKYLAWISSIGCPFNCSFCADPLVYKRRWLALEPMRMADEIEQLVKKFGITQFGFWDDNFFINHKRVEAFIDEIIKRKINIKWTGTIRISSIKRIPVELLHKCAKAGLHMVHPGVEGATQEALDYMNKSEKAKDTIPAAKKLADAGIKALYSFIVGLPDEPVSTLQDTFDMIEQLKRIDPNNIMPVNFYTPFPGNRLYDISLQKGMKTLNSLEEWADFDTRMGNTPWLTNRYRQEVMKRDRYYYPAAFPSEVLNRKLLSGKMRLIYRMFHKIAAWRVRHKNFSFDLDWQILYLYWKFWGRFHKNLKFLPNINFRW